MKYLVQLLTPRHQNHAVLFYRPENTPELIEDGGNIIYDGDLPGILLTCAECGVDLVMGEEYGCTPVIDDVSEPWRGNEPDPDAWRGS